MKLIAIVNHIGKVVDIQKDFETAIKVAKGMNENLQSKEYFVNEVEISTEKLVKIANEVS